MHRIHSRKFLTKAIAALLIDLLLFECFLPTAAWALTSGPSQPEFSTFSPAGASNMVDPFTGDFSYNIDLLSVPGFEGGYPINLSYNAGIKMEQEASWVGLGWSLNTGAITRQLRGIPDDFKSDTIVKVKRMKPSRTVSFGLALPPSEAVGFDLSKLFQQGSIKGYYNNYTGVGYQLGADFSLFNYENQKGRFNGGVSLTYDSQSGFGMRPNVSYGSRLQKKGTSFLGAGLGVGFSSREGINDITFDMRKTYPEERKNAQTTFVGSEINQRYQKSAAGVSFAASAPVSSIDFPRVSNSFSLRIKGGISVFTVTLDGDVDLYYSSSKISENKQELPAFGYFYSEEKNVEKALMDFHREKDVQTTKLSKTLPITVATNDVFNVSAQGLGAMVRGYRSDFGFYSDPKFSSVGLHLGAGFESDAEAASGSKTGLNNVTIQPSSSYSGDWSEGKGDLGSTFYFEGRRTTNQNKNNGFYEPVSFKSAGEITPDYEARYSDNHIFSNDAHRINIRKKATINGAIPIIRNEFSNQNELASNFNNYSNRRKNRVKRVTEYQFLTRKEAGLDSDATRRGHHIGKIIALQPGGKRYEFGKPLYNFKQKEVAFSVDSEGNSDGILTYSTKNASLGNKSGKDHLYQYTELPPYAYSFLITGIKSMDYVDIDDNGYSKNDFGEYVKFEYTNPGVYKWRAPYGKLNANASLGNLSSKGDNKGSYNYGEKETGYVEKIETKTHLAVFKLSERKDAVQVNDEMGGRDEDVNKLKRRKKKLDKIILYKKTPRYSGDTNDLIPIKTVHFEYKYSLCKGVPNKYSDNTEGGKLTLKKVWFSYGKNETSNNKLAFYEFGYNEDKSDENPNYDPGKIDRWGNYQLKRFDSEPNSPIISRLKDSPYTTQSYSKGEMDNIAGVWSLKQIKTPSGGEIDIAYEMDDYQYVQNKKAMMMAVIKGFGPNPTDISNRLANNTRYVFAQIPRKITTTDLPKYFEGVDRVYFKVLIGLKRSFIGSKKMAYDYVEGYAEREGPPTIVSTNGNYTTVAIKLKRVDLNDNGTGATCPIRKAGFQHLRMNRGDLLNNPVFVPEAGNPMAILTPLLSIVGVLRSAASLITGFNTIASISYCKSADLNNSDHPSYVRVNAVGKKYGGGYRVKRITMNDNWAKLSSASGSQSFSYGKEFIYRLKDGSSSGVASYEPLIGGEENPFKKPIYYGPDKLFFPRDDAFYVEEPLGESFFPAPVVGYSKVITKSLSHQNVTAGKSGVVVSEFYTAKDFPTIVKRTNIMSKRNAPRKIFIPLLGMKTMVNDGYSQGVSVQLNNMHGKEKKQSTYRYMEINGADEYSNLPTFKTALEKLDGEAVVSSIESHYHLKDDAEYQAGNSNEIQAVVNVLQDDGNVKRMEVGKHVDFYGSLRENYTETSTFSFSPNFHQLYMVFIPVLAPLLMKSTGMYREALTTKVISRNGVLKKQIAYDGVAEVTTENMVYDNETGEVRLSKSDNSFEDPVYNYHIPGDRYYKAFKGAYQNLGVEITQSNLSANTDAFRVGDMVYHYPDGKGKSFQILWVKDVLTSSVSFVDVNGNNATVSKGLLKVMRSGNRNLQPYGAGKIVSLENPLGLLNNSNNCKNANSISVDLTQLNIYTTGGKFVNGGTVKAKRVITDNTNSGPYLTDFDFTIDAQLNSGSVLYRWLWKSSGSSTPTTLLGFSFTPTQKTGWEKATISYSGSGLKKAEPITLTLNGESHPIPIDTLYPELKGACIRSNAKVLHSEAYTYTDKLNIEYEDFLRTQIDATAYTALQGKISKNPYRYGKKGIYRVEAPYFYRVKRKQTGGGTTFRSDVRHDGVYNLFDWYDYDTTAANPGWIPKGESTLYSPYGHELETKDAKGVFSSALYGYENLLPTAVAANAKYKEVAFEGFEDYKGAAYPDAGLIGHGHLIPQPDAANVIQENEKHTGRSALVVGSSVSYPLKSGMQLQQGQEYLVSAWVKKTGNSPITVTVNGKSVSYDDTKTNIEGWQQLMLTFTKGATDPVLTFTGSTFYMDDVRVFPNDGSMVSYVYDKDRLRLMAVLDNQNYATIYNYDLEGNLTQVKQETERGIMTLKSGRITTKKQLNP